MMRGENAAIVVRFFGREIGDEDAVGAGVAGGACKFFEAHLQDGIVVAEEHERNLRGFANAAHQIEDAGQRGAGFQRAFGGALNGGAVGERIAERNAQLDDIGAGFGQGENELQRGVERRIAGGDVGDDAEFAGCAQVGETFGDTSRVGGCARSWDFEKDKA